MVILQRGLLLGGAILLALVGATVVMGVCTGNGSVLRNVPTVDVGGVNNAAAGRLDRLSSSTARPGDEIVITGREWAGEGPVEVFLLTGEQVASDRDDPREWVVLGEARPEQDGAISLHFRLAESYETPAGTRVPIEAGQTWYVWAYQSTGQGGSHGMGVGPLTIK